MNLKHHDVLRKKNPRLLTKSVALRRKKNLTSWLALFTDRSNLIDAVIPMGVGIRTEKWPRAQEFGT